MGEQAQEATESKGAEAPQVSAMPEVTSHDPETGGAESTGASVLGGGDLPPGLFDDEAYPSDEDLQGESGEEAAEGAAEKSDADTEKADEAKADAEGEKEAAKEEGEKKDDEKKDDEKKPPEGFVPQQALHEERSRRKEISGQLYNANQQIRQLQAELRQAQESPGGKDEFADLEGFKVKSKEEIEEMSDYEQGEYFYNLDRYRQKQVRDQEAERSKSQQEAERQRMEEERTEIIREASMAIREQVPQLFEEGSDLDAKLVAHAEANGLNREAAAILTNPATRVIDPASGQELLMGHGALEMLSLLNNTYANGNAENLRKQIENEIREEVKKEVTAELTAKFRAGGERPTSLGEATPAAERPVAGDVGSEEDWLSRTPEERRQLLGA